MAALMTYTRRLTSEKLCIKISTHVKKTYFQKLLYKQLTTFNDNHTGTLTHQLNKEIDEISFIVTSELSALIRGFLFFIGGVSFVFLYCFHLVLFTLLPILLLGVSGGMFGKRLRNEVQLLSSQEKSCNSFIQEKLMQIKTVKLFSGENIELAELKKHIQNMKVQGEKVANVRSKFFAIMEFLGENTVIWGLGYGVYIMQGDPSLDIGKLTAFATYAVYAGMGYRLLTDALSEVVKATSLYSIISRTMSDTQDNEEALQVNQENCTQASIEIQGVSFTYPGRQDLALESISMNIKAGEIWGLIGVSGCGKSTLFHLLTHLYKPDSGKIFINSVDISTKPTAWARAFFSIVSQENLLFSTNIIENLRYSNPSATLEEVRKACARADALEFIENLPNKFETLVGENGFSLSGGQRQRICIARAFLKQPKILLLDEATSGLDAASEGVVQGILEREVKKRGFTVIMITHRVSSLKDLTDFVAVMKAGRVVQVGSFSTIEKSPEFLSLSRV